MGCGYNSVTACFFGKPWSESDESQLGFNLLATCANAVIRESQAPRKTGSS